MTASRLFADGNLYDNALALMESWIVEMCRYKNVPLEPERVRGLADHMLHAKELTSVFQIATLDEAAKMDVLASLDFALDAYFLAMKETSRRKHDGLPQRSLEDISKDVVASGAANRAAGEPIRVWPDRHGDFAAHALLSAVDFIQK